MSDPIYVKKRNGRLQELDINKINLCSERACENLENVSASEVVLDAHVQLYDKITTKEIDKALILSARQKIEKESNYNYVASRLLLFNIHKEVFGASIDKDGFDHQYKLAFIKNTKLLVKEEILSESLLDFDLKKLSKSLVLDRDFKFKYLGLQTLYDRYLLRVDERRLEAPQSFWMRVAMGLALNEKNKDQKAIEFYETISQFLLCPSTPTLFNSGTTHSQLSSCYLNTFDDSIDGIFEGLWQEARKSKYAGGLGFDVTNFRASNSFVKGTNGKSSGLIPWLKIYNDTLIAVDQGGKRPGAGCAYLEPWHLDIEDFLNLKKNTGDERRRCHDMNTAIWVPNLFFEHIEKNKDWYLFSPSDVRDLHDLYGEAFDKRYKKYCKMADEGEIENFEIVNIKNMWKKMLRLLFETGHPWITFKDNANLRYSNAHEGVIHSSNLCTEIFLHTKPSRYDDGIKTEIGETAVCNLSSINLKEHLKKDGKLNFKKLAKTISTQVRMLDNVIDLNFYPTKEAEKANLKHRPIGAGSMGWADVFHSYKINFSSDDAVKFSDELYEFISYHCILNSSRLSKERGKYSTYENSLWSQDLLPIDTYKGLMDYLNQKPIIHRGKKYCPELDWKEARLHIKQYGMRNSNTMAIAPTATISYIQGCSPCVEPDFSVLFVYENKSGNLTVVNEWFIQECRERNIWNQGMIDAIKAVDGDLGRLNGDIPEDLKERYCTAFDHDQFKLLECGAAKQKWIDMGQSLNLFNKKTSLKYLNDLYFYAKRLGLKSTYYLRNRAASEIEKSTIDAGNLAGNLEVAPESADKVCNINESCESCQ
ncbi:MAG: ribonucleoside-diphosphate reductase subunit alpha [Parcubacteria group bacterium]|nr:ribonucleoside-diphosphate reductase subunit alpha [Parcubacteria group bacterium]|tara:strand:+ start:22479 stop:24935 length:2457 start_codon:yes stop_codon:yes gene_type:complete